MSFVAGKRLDVIIIIMKTVKCCFVSPGMQKVGVCNFFRLLRSQNCIPTFKTVAPPLPGWNRESKICVQPTNEREWGAAKSNLAHLQKSTRRAWAALLNFFVLL